MEEKFGKDYYKTFYPVATIGPRKRTAVEVFRITRNISQMVFQADLRSVADVGAGMGLWKEAIVADNPDLFGIKPPVPFDTFDASSYATSTFGCKKMDIVFQEPKDVDGRIRYDLVICNGVFGYLADDQLQKAIQRLRKYASRFLYVGELYCKEDIQAGKYDMRGTDAMQKVRSIQDYWKALRDGGFFFVGMGLWANGNHKNLFMASEVGA